MNYLQILELVMQFLPTIMKAIQAIQADTGKPLIQVIEDVLAHLTPGQPNAAALGPHAPTSSAPPVLSTAN